MRKGTKNEEPRTMNFEPRLKRRFLYSSILVLGSSLINCAFAQKDSAKHAHKFTVNGYIKYLDEVSFAGSATELETVDLIHNRLNFRYQPDSNFNFRLEVRNRLYYGELVREYPNFAALETSSNGTFNLSENWVNQNAVLFNSAIDRASAEYMNGKWDITIGRQRINWGISTVWTPNDIFNAFNYFDFDYEERPGSDAVRIQYAFTSSSSLDLAVCPGRTSEQNIEALMYHFNKWDYDFQVFSGVYQEDFTAGAGWAGNIAGAGFKGEVSYFTPYRHFSDSGAIAASISVDYGFQDGIYLLVSGLYNSPGKDTIPNIAQLTTESLSPKNIFPFRYTLFAEISYSFTPILKASLGGMYSPSGNAFIMLPTVTYSIADNWVLDLIGQSFFSEQGGGYRTLGNGIYMRIKWGF
ncbi:MAG: hypothetical protein ACLQQ4_02995 [Bacteroidia bacterium]